jgi:hypothetical protein
LPFLEIFIPSGILDGRVESNVLFEVVRFRYSNKISEDLFLYRKFASPIAILSKAIAVQDRFNIASTAWICVVMPFMVLEEDAVGQAFAGTHHVPPRAGDFSKIIKS